MDADANSLGFNLEVDDVSRFGQLKVESGMVTTSFSSLVTPSFGRGLRPAPAQFHPRWPDDGTSLVQASPTNAFKPQQTPRFIWTQGTMWRTGPNTVD